MKIYQIEIEKWNTYWWKYICKKCGGWYIADSSLNPLEPKNWHSIFCLDQELKELE